MKGAMTCKGDCWDKSVTETLFSSLYVEGLREHDGLQEKETFQRKKAPGLIKPGEGRLGTGARSVSYFSMCS